MAGEVEICNLALAQLGADRITNIDNPQTNNEQLCSLYYPIVRDAMLEEIDWSFTQARVVLSIPDVEKPAWGYGQQFSLPSDYSRIIDVRSNDRDNAPSDFEWRLEGNKLLCDNVKVYMRYVRSNLPTSDYSHMFKIAFAARLAAEMCIQITENETLMATLWGVFDNKMQEAKSSDQLQGKSQVKHSTNLLRVR